MNLTPHFTFEEMTATSRSALLAENRADAGRYRAALTATAEMLEVVRAHFGRPIRVHSGFRCVALNTAIGGSKYSQHMLGEAADFHVDGVALEDVWRWIRDESGLAYGQCLLEHRPGEPASWVHLSLGEPWRPRDRCRQSFVAVMGESNSITDHHGGGRSDQPHHEAPRGER